MIYNVDSQQKEGGQHFKQQQNDIPRAVRSCHQEECICELITYLQQYYQQQSQYWKQDLQHPEQLHQQCHQPRQHYSEQQQHHYRQPRKLQHLQKSKQRVSILISVPPTLRQLQHILNSLSTILVHNQRQLIVLADFLTNNQQTETILPVVAGERGWIRHQNLLSNDQVTSIIKSWIESVSKRVVKEDEDGDKTSNSEPSTDILYGNNDTKDQITNIIKPCIDHEVTDLFNIVIEDDVNELTHNTLKTDINTTADIDSKVEVVQNGAKEEIRFFNSKSNTIITDNDGGQLQSTSFHLLEAFHLDENGKHLNLPGVEIVERNSSSDIDSGHLSKLNDNTNHKKRLPGINRNNTIIVISQTQMECKHLQTTSQDINFINNIDNDIKGDQIVCQLISNGRDVIPSHSNTAIMSSTLFRVIFLTLDLLLCINRPNKLFDSTVDMVILNTTIEDVVTYERVKAMLLKMQQPKRIEFVVSPVFEVSRFVFDNHTCANECVNDMSVRIRITYTALSLGVLRNW